MSTTRACAPLTWGHGPRHLEVFLEPTCPYSGRAFGKFDELLAYAGHGRLKVTARLMSQPWHTFSPVTVRAVLAASTLPEGRDAAKTVLAAIFAHRDAFEPTDHRTGPLLDQSPRSLLAQIERLSGFAVTEAFEQSELTNEVKWLARYARQNGIHVTPTFMVDGLVEPKMSSGDSVEAWVQTLGL